MSRAGRAIGRSAVLVLAGLAVAGCSTFRHKAPPPPTPVAEAPPPAPPPAPAPSPPLIHPPMPAKPSCVPRNMPRSPKYPDTDAELREAGGAADRYQLMAAGRLLRIQRLAELEKVIEGCRGPGQ